MPKLDRMAWLFSLNCFAAAMLALAIGFWLDLPRPYWALMTVYIISQPLAGAVRSKAVYRVFGTLLGAAFAVATVPALVDSPLLLSLVIALWVGLCLFVSLLDRTPRAYVVLLAGYTAALVAFPTVGQPELIFDVAVARVEEILLGILCATLTHSLFFPRPVGAVLHQRLIAWLAEADQWALDLFRHGAGADQIADRRHLAVATTEIHMLAQLLPFDSSALRDTAAVVRTMEQRLLLLIPVLSGVGDRLAALSGDLGEVAPLLSLLEDWIVGGCRGERAQVVAARLAGARDAATAADWTGLLRESLIARLQDLLANLAEAHALQRHLDRPDQPLPPQLAQALRHPPSRPLHQDAGLAAVSGLSAVIAIMLVSGLWIATAWPEGAIAAAMAGVFCALFAAFDDPAPAIVGFGLFSGLALPVAALYQFAILPAIDGFAMLALALAPPFLLGAACMLDRRSALPALAFVIGLASAMALQENFSADFAAFVNSNSAQYVALFVVLVITRGMRSLGTEAAARRLLRQSWRALAALAQRDRQVDLAALAARLVDRFGLLTPKLAVAEGTEALRDLRVAMNLALLQRHRDAFDPGQSAAVGRLLTAVGAHFAVRAKGGGAAPDATLLTALDDGLDRLAAIGRQRHRDGIAALVGLRRNLFPLAPPFQAAMVPP